MPKNKKHAKNGVGKPCCYCKRTMLAASDNPGEHGQVCSVEHIVPRSYNGTNEPSNLTYACRRCNSLRGHLNHELFSMFARYVLQAYPNAPTVLLRASLQRFITSLAEIAVRNRRETSRALSHALLTLGEDLKRHG